MLVQLGDIKNIKKETEIQRNWNDLDYRIQIALPCLLNLSVTKCAKLMRFNKITVLKATLLVILVHFLALYFHYLQFCPELIPIIIIFSFPFEFGQKGLGGF